MIKALVPSGDGQRRRGGLEVSSRNPRWWFKGKDEVAYSFAALFTRETADSAVVREIVIQIELFLDIV